jgi:phage portal protein BeeE
MAQFQVSPCTLSDLNAMTYVYVQAFNNTFMNAMLFPPQSHAPDSIRTWLYPRFKKHLTQGRDEMKLFKITEVATGRLAAVARFGYPFKLTEEEQARRDEEKAQEEKAREEVEKETGKSVKYPEAANVEACDWYFKTLDEMREKYMKWSQDYS